MTDDERFNIALNFFVDNLTVSDARSWGKDDRRAYCK